MKKRKIRLLIDLMIGNAQARYEAKYELMRFLTRKAGFRIYNMNLRWHDDQEYLSIWKAFPESNNYIHERHFTLYKLAKSINSVAGDTAECGVLAGASSHLILSANTSNNKIHHIFDSFSGLSAPEDLDKPLDKKIMQWEGGDLAIDEGTVRRNLSSFENIKYYKGWIPERFGEVSDIKFSLVHIDVDLYRATLDCLEFFYPRIIPGGLLICDDYGSTACPGAFKAMNEYFEDKREKIAELTTGQAFVIKQATD